MATSTLATPRSGAQATPGDRDRARPPPGRRAACRSATGSGSAPPWPSRAAPSSRRTPRASSARAPPATSSPTRSRTGPGTISRAGKPCARRQRLVVHLQRDHRLAGRVHHPGRRHARPSSRRPTGRRAASPPAWTPAMSSTSRSRTPVHLALPTSSPPTSLLTQAIVTYCSNIGSADQLVPGERRLAIDQAVDPERPRRRCRRSASSSAVSIR